MISAALHSLFFPNLKAVPKPRWKESFAELGTTETIQLVRSGKSISATLVTPKQGAVRGVAIFAHPLHPKAKYYFSEPSRSQIYLERGYAVAAFDFNGFGESDRIDLYFSRDAAAVIDELKHRFPDKPFILHGLSFGSFHIIPALSHLPLGAGVVLENTSRSLYDYWKRWWHTRAIVSVAIKLSPGPIANMNIAAALEKLKRPDLRYLMIASEFDDSTPADEMRDLFEIIESDRKTFELIPGASHLKAPQADRSRYVAALERMIQ